VIAIITKDVVAALTIAYDILVGGLLVAILGGLVWKRGTGVAAAVSMAVGSVITLGTMIVLEINAEVPLDGILRQRADLLRPRSPPRSSTSSVSLLTKPTEPAVMSHWYRRVAGNDTEEVPVSAGAQ
jgi:SSS family solute:Na+ symporter